MRRLYATALTLAVLLSAGRSDAQSIHRLSLDHVTGLHQADTIYSDLPVVFHIRLTSASQTESPVIWLWNGFRIYSPTGAEWLTATGTFTDAISNQMFGSIQVSPHSVTGSGSDTLAFNAVGGFVGCGLPEPFDELAMEIAIGPISSSWEGHTVCLDSVSASWSWQLGLCDVWDGAVIPEWDGPHCFAVERRPCIDPFTAEDLVPGDANHDGVVGSADLIYIVNFVFKGGEPDACWITGDANCTGTATSSDIIYLVNFVFKSGPPPCNVCSFVWSSPELFCHSITAR